MEKSGDAVRGRGAAIFRPSGKRGAGARGGVGESGARRQGGDPADPAVSAGVLDVGSATGRPRRDSRGPPRLSPEAGMSLSDGAGGATAGHLLRGGRGRWVLWA